MSIRYRVTITPLISEDVYGSAVDVSDRIDASGVGSIKRSIDAGDYTIGVFTYGDISLKGHNHNGYFNDQTDSRSIFPYTRDRAKVEITFEKTEVTRNSAGRITDTDIASSITFRGLINEEATRVDLVQETITFKILSRDSVIRNTKVSAGVVSNGMTCKAAMEAILNVPKITAILNFDADDINPDLNFAIDDGTKFDNKSTRDAMNSLLLASNSIMLINDDGDMIVRDRTEETSGDVVNLFGKSDIYGRENIISIDGYNTGRHRMFTSFLVNDTTATDNVLSAELGFRQKKLTLDFITDADTELEIAEQLLDEFKAPKLECAVKISTDLAKTIDLLDRISINYPLRVKPIEGAFLPVIGVTQIGAATDPLPYTFGSLSIDPRLAFKVIEIDENPQNFETTLKLRQTGTDLNDGVFNEVGNAIIGFAVIGEAVIAEGGSEADQWNPSVVGAAQIGYTQVA